MGVRIGFDMDGVLADFAGAFRDVEHRLFGPADIVAPEPPEVEAEKEAERDSGQAPRRAVPSAPPASSSPADLRRRRDAIWNVIHRTPDFWCGLQPLDPTAVRRIHEMMLRKEWEIFFITQRPATAGQTVQRQTQKWLVEQGFDLPSVLVINGSRGAAAGALRLNYHVDDSPQNCIDVVADSQARTILIVPRRDELTEKAVKPLGIGVARSIGDALDLLEQVPQDGSEPGLLARLSRMIGWK